MKRQKGYLFIIAAILVVVFGFLAVTVGYISATGIYKHTNYVDTGRSFRVAEAGLRKATRELISGEMVCADINGHADYTNTEFKDGHYTVTATLYNPTVAAVATLSAAVSAVATTIPVSTLTGYAPSGRVYVDKEAIDYYGTSSDSVVCSGSSYCLLVAGRGADNSIASIHALGSFAFQNQCDLVSVGGIPNLINPVSQRSVSGNVTLKIGGGGWIVGDSFGGEVILQRDGDSWTRVGPYSAIPNKKLSAVITVNDNNAWIVGAKDGGNGIVAHWDGSSWTRLTSGAIPNKNLFDVDCVVGNDCWLVGDGKTFMHWDGSSWSNGSVNGNVPNKSINGVSCTDASHCWAVGARDSGNGIIARWNGSSWVRWTASAIPNKNLLGVDCVDNNDCWLVGESKTFMHWNGSAWSNGSVAGSVPNKTFAAVACVDGNDCWAVGDKDGGDALFVHWNGSTWTRVATDGTINVKNLDGLTCANTSDCWAVGQAATVAHWDGSSWTSVGVSIPSINLLGVSVSRDDIFTPEVVFWRENFN
jgi:Tfp pilus assembly protein PilX